MATSDSISATFRILLHRVDLHTATELLTIWNAATTPQAKFGLLLEQLPDVIDRSAIVNNQLAVNHYLQLRHEAGVTSPFQLSASPPATHEQTRIMIRRATRGWLDGRDDSKVLSELFGGSRRLVRLPARETIVSATRNDPARPRWARVTTGASCSFCLMLASRGAVYSSDTVKFNAHDHCRCMATPVFNSRQLPAFNREMQAEWNAVTQESRNSAEARQLWREHIERSQRERVRPIEDQTRRDSEFSKEEQRLADYLRNRHHHVIAYVKDQRRGWSSFDAFVDDIPTEFKTLSPGSSGSTIMNRMGQAGRQAEEVHFDVRDTALSLEEAERTLRRVRGAHGHRVHAVRIIGNNFDIREVFQ